MDDVGAKKEKKNISLVDMLVEYKNMPNAMERQGKLLFFCDLLQVSAFGSFVIINTFNSSDKVASSYLKQQLKSLFLFQNRLNLL